MGTKPRFKKTSWAGNDNYECQLCPFATLDHDLIEAHVRERHPLPSEEAATSPTTSQGE